MTDTRRPIPGRVQQVRTAETGESVVQHASRLMEHLKRQLEELDRREASLNKQLITFDNERRSLKQVAQQLQLEADQRDQALVARAEELSRREADNQQTAQTLEAREQELDDARKSVEADRAELRARLEEELSVQRDEIAQQRLELEQRSSDLDHRDHLLEQAEADLEERTNKQEAHLRRSLADITARQAELNRAMDQHQVWMHESDRTAALRLGQLRRFRELLDLREASLNEEFRLLEQQQEEWARTLLELREQHEAEVQSRLEQAQQQAESIRQQQDELTNQAQTLEARRLRLERMRDELEQKQQDQLEARLITDQVHAQIVAALDAPAAQARMQVARDKLFEHYRELREALTRRRQDCEEAHRLLLRSRDEFRLERDDHLQLLAEREEQLAAERRQLAEQATESANREVTFATARKEWRQHRLEAERTIRSLLNELEERIPATLESTRSRPDVTSGPSSAEAQDESAGDAPTSQAA